MPVLPFAEDAKLLPAKLFERLLDKSQTDRPNFPRAWKRCLPRCKRAAISARTTSLGSTAGCLKRWQCCPHPSE